MSAANRDRELIGEGRRVISFSKGALHPEPATTTREAAASA